MGKTQHAKGRNHMTKTMLYHSICVTYDDKLGTHEASYICTNPGEKFDDNKNILRQPQMQLIHYGIFYKGFLVKHRKSSANPMYLTGSGYFSDVLRDSIEYNAYMAEAQLKLKYLAIADWWDMYDTNTLVDETEEELEVESSPFIEGHPI